jgi:dethiobiotin synthetase
MTARLFVTGIGTGVGKTVASAILVAALRADYWKAIQCGDLDESDTSRIRALVPGARCHPERYLLRTPCAPAEAAAIEGIRIDLPSFVPPVTDAPLVIEGAGGLLVPLHGEATIADLVTQLGAAAVVVSRNYLGSINHTLLTMEALAHRRIPVAGIVFNGPPAAASEASILHRYPVPVLGRIPEATQIDRSFIASQADAVRRSWEGSDLSRIRVALG